MSQTLVVCIPPDTDLEQARRLQEELSDAIVGVRVIVIAANQIAVIDDGLVTIDAEPLIGAAEADSCDSSDAKHAGR